MFGRWERRQPQPGSATQVNAWNNKVLSAMLARQCYAAGPGIVLSEQPEWAGLSAGRHALGFAVGQEPMPASRAPMRPVDFSTGDGLLDQFIDQPP